MDAIKTIIRSVIGVMADRQPCAYDKIERIWQNLLSKQELGHAKILGVDKETLLVCVDSPVWLYHMRIRKEKILKQLKEEVLGVKHISFKIGKVR